MSWSVGADFQQDLYAAIWMSSWALVLLCLEKKKAALFCVQEKRLRAENMRLRRELAQARTERPSLAPSPASAAMPSRTSPPSGEFSQDCQVSLAELPRLYSVTNAFINICLHVFVLHVKS